MSSPSGPRPVLPATRTTSRDERVGGPDEPVVGQMIPWWVWLLIWIGLVLALIAMLVLVGILLFRKLMRMFAALESLSTKLEILEGVSDLADDQRTELDQQAQLAILAGEQATRERRDRVREAAHARRDARHDARIVRGKAMLKVDASTREWFPHSTSNRLRKPRRTN